MLKMTVVDTKEGKRVKIEHNGKVEYRKERNYTVRVGPKGDMVEAAPDSVEVSD